MKPSNLKDVAVYVVPALVLVLAAGVALRMWRQRQRDYLAEYRLAESPGKLAVSISGKNETPLSEAECSDLMALLSKCELVPTKGKPVLPLKMSWWIHFARADDTRFVFMVSGERGRLSMYKGRSRRSCLYKVPPELEEFVREKLETPGKRYPIRED